MGGRAISKVQQRRWQYFFIAVQDFLDYHGDDGVLSGFVESTQD